MATRNRVSFLVYTLLISAVWVAWYFLGGPGLFAGMGENWGVSVTMLFGSFIAGATSEGGGALAFPVFTKLLDIPPADAKIFSLAIQSVGMTCASLMILVMRVPVEWRAVRWASLGGVAGIGAGSCLAGVLPPSLIKMSFTVMVSSFALVLIIMKNNNGLDRNTFLIRFGLLERAVLVVVGVCGGIMSGLVGNGIDIITFSVLVLLFKLCEKVATPTSVILMAINSLAGFFLHVEAGVFTPQIQAYWLAAVPVVVVGAPFGAIVCARMRQSAIAWVLISLIFVELGTSLWIIRLPADLALLCGGVFLVSTFLYYAMYQSGFYWQTAASVGDPSGLDEN
ncbi:MAG: sulfite exporter TauE/SafE family protein [Pseudomonadota bacterium]